MDQETRKLMKMHKALYTRDGVDNICQEKKVDEDLAALKIAGMQRYNDSKTP